MGSTSYLSVHAAQAQPASAGAGAPGRGPPQAWHVATASLFASVHAGQAHGAATSAMFGLRESTWLGA